ncbi:hypothetical protein D9M68_66420 [compost metagenome]
MQALETLVRMVRAGHYKGPLNLTWIGIGGGFDGPNPFNFFNFVHRAPDGCTLTAESLLKNDQHLPHGPRQPLLPGLRQDTAGNRALGADERSRTRASSGGGAGPPRAVCRYGPRALLEAMLRALARASPASPPLPGIALTTR